MPVSPHHKESPIHGLYNSWRAMKDRCLNTNSRGYLYYGSKGISVCDEWLKFSGFRDWAISNGWQESMTIDRDDTKKNYEPSNCKWVTRAINTARRNKQMARKVLTPDEIFRIEMLLELGDNQREISSLFETPLITITRMKRRMRDTCLSSGVSP